MPSVAQPMPEPAISEPVPPAPDYPAGDPLQPGPAPMPAMDDYVPAYGQVEEAPAAGAPVGATPDPEDILLAVSVVSSEVEGETRASQAIQNIRTEAIAEAPTQSKAFRQKIKAAELPFDMLVRGTPLIGTVYSPSGGVGKSSTAMNLAVYIASVAAEVARKKQKSSGEEVRVPRVLVLDGDIVQGSLALRLKGELTPSIHTLQLYIDDRRAAGFDADKAWPQVYEGPPPGEKSMRDFVMWPEAIPNLNVLAAPQEPDLFYDFGAGDYRDLLRMLGRFYDVIIIDSGTDVVLESQRAWLAHANEVFMITAPEVDRIFNAAKAARYIAKSRPHPMDQRDDAPKMPPLATSEKISVVMTRYDADSGLDPEGAIKDMFPWLNDHQKFFVPDVSAEILKANNSAEFLVLHNAEYAKSISSLAAHLFARYAEMKQKRTLHPN